MDMTVNILGILRDVRRRGHRHPGERDRVWRREHHHQPRQAGPRLHQARQDVSGPISLIILDTRATLLSMEAGAIRLCS